MTLYRKYTGPRFKRLVPSVPPPITPNDLSRLFWFDVFDGVNQEDGSVIDWLSNDPNETVATAFDINYEDVGFPSGSSPGDAPYLISSGDGELVGTLAGDATTEFSLFLVFEVNPDFFVPESLFSYDSLNVFIDLSGENLILGAIVNGSVVILNDLEFSSRYVAHLSYSQSSGIIRLAIQAFPTDEFRINTEGSVPSYILTQGNTFKFISAVGGIWFVEALLVPYEISGKDETQLFRYFNNKYPRIGD